LSETTVPQVVVENEGEEAARPGFHGDSPLVNGALGIDQVKQMKGWPWQLHPNALRLARVGTPLSRDSDFILLFPQPSPAYRDNGRPQ
jgi:hypothetical protein